MVSFGLSYEKVERELSWLKPAMEEATVRRRARDKTRIARNYDVIDPKKVSDDQLKEYAFKWNFHKFIPLMDDEVYHKLGSLLLYAQRLESSDKKKEFKDALKGFYFEFDRQLSSRTMKEEVYNYFYNNSLRRIRKDIKKGRLDSLLN